MDQQRQLTWQLTIVMTVSIVTFGGGAMYLLAMGKDVPGALWAIIGGLVNTLVSLGGFFNMRQMHAASLWHLAQATAPRTDTVTIPAGGTTTVKTGSEGSMA